MAFIPGLISMGTGILGKLFGGGQKIDQSILDSALKQYSKLFGQFGSEKGLYSNYLQGGLDYFSKGGSATEKNRQMAIGGALAPINQMIPDARTRMQNAQARAGLFLPSTVSAKSDIDMGIKNSWERATAIEEVNQRFDQTMDKNKAIAAQLSQAQVAQLNNLLSALTQSQGQLGLEDKALNAKISQQSGFSLGNLFSSLIGGGAGDLMKSLQSLFGGGGDGGGFLDFMSGGGKKVRE
jgi:hypothetical protein